MIVPHYFQTNAKQALFNSLQATVNSNPVVAMPTGTGKSVVIGDFTRDVLNMWPGAPIGIYSAGLKTKDFMQPIIYGGVASMVNSPSLFGHRDLLLVDECHLIGKNEAAQYQMLIDALRVTNPWLRVIGFTATPYRMGMGLITNGGIFTEICYDITRLEDFNRLIAEGFIAMLITQKTTVEVDVRSVDTNSTNGDYVQSQIEERVSRITEAAIQETVQYARTRHSANLGLKLLPFTAARKTFPCRAKSATIGLRRSKRASIKSRSTTTY
jgi:DNA repair protein RadD